MSEGYDIIDIARTCFMAAATQDYVYVCPVEEFVAQILAHVIEHPKHAS